jgi:hypothetical protein
VEIAEERARILHSVAALDLRVALLRGEAGHSGYSAWRQYGLSRQFYEEGSLESSFESAARELSGLTADQQTRYRRHAAGSLAEAMAVATTMGAGERYGSLLASFFPELEGGLRLDTPENAYTSAALGNCSVTNLAEGFTFDAFQVSTVTLDFDVNRALDVFPARMDPRTWDVIASQTYENTHRTPGSPKNPFDEPARLETRADELAVQGTAWGPGFLYENARLSIGGSELTDFKNVLLIDFETPTPAADELHLTYALHEALSIEIQSSTPISGGLDRDRGEVKITKNPDGSTHHHVTKSVRIAQPADRRDVLNWLMAINLRFWLKNLVLLGVCD